MTPVTKTAEELKLKDKVKKKKSKKLVEEKLAAEGGVEKKDKKKKKKKTKKEKKTEKKSSNESAPSTEAIDPSTPPLDSSKVAKSKKVKKSRKAAEESSTPKAKKPKKSGKAPAPAIGYANVGDKSLATSGKPIVKALYEEHADIAAMSDADVQKFREERQMSIDNVPAEIKPVTAFSQLGLPKDMLHSVRNFTTPSPVQSQCWPIMMGGHDVVSIAATGSGKTLGFGLPALRHIQAQKEAGVVSGKGPFVMVMAPTRELAQQIAVVLEEAGEKCGTASLCVYGGVPKYEQKQALRKGIDIIIGTPGRMKDLVEEGACVLRQVTMVVLDEADRMLDLGFEPDIRALVGRTRSDRQTAMFSATWPTEVQKLAMEFMIDAVQITIGSADLCAAHTITQHVEVIDPRERERRLLKLLDTYTSKKAKARVLVFVLYKKEAPRIESLLARAGWNAAAVHGDITQDKRNAAVDGFKQGKVPLLIATDVAARGLDIPDVEFVINFSFPLTIEDYVHRIGRTGRAGKTGVAHTFFCGPQDKPRAGELINVLREADQKVPDELLAFGTTVKKKESKLYGAHFKDIDINAKSTKMKFDDSDDEE